MSQENVPPGYEAIPLGEALNGPGKSVQGAEGENNKHTISNGTIESSQPIVLTSISK